MRRVPPRTLGVEEEFHLVDLKTRRLTARAPELLAGLSDHYVAELQRWSCRSGETYGASTVQ